LIHRQGVLLRLRQKIEVIVMKGWRRKPYQDRALRGILRQRASRIL